jgi:hypothetical protein
LDAAVPKRHLGDLIHMRRQPAIRTVVEWEAGGLLEPTVRSGGCVVAHATQVLSSALHRVIDPTSLIPELVLPGDFAFMESFLTNGIRISAARG